MGLTTCPECDLPAEVEYRDVLESTDGPVEHARVTCVDRHWFFLPVAMLGCSPQPREPSHRATTFINRQVRWPY